MAMAVTGSTTVAYQSASLAHRRIGAHAVGLVIGAVIGVAGAGAMWMALDFRRAVVSSLNGFTVGGLTEWFCLQ